MTNFPPFSFLRGFQASIHPAVNDCYVEWRRPSQRRVPITEMVRERHGTFTVFTHREEGHGHPVSAMAFRMDAIPSHSVGPFVHQVLNVENHLMVDISDDPVAVEALREWLEVHIRSFWALRLSAA